MSILNTFASKLFPEGDFQNIRTNAPDQMSYNIDATRDLVKNQPFNPLAPAMALTFSLPYDTIQGIGRAFKNVKSEPGILDYDNIPNDITFADIGKSIAAENPFDSLIGRTYGATLGLGDKLKSYGKTISDAIISPAYAAELDDIESKLTQEIPEVFYHATYKALLPSIKATGLDTREAALAWEDSKPGIVYLANDPSVAESYAEASEDVSDENIPYQAPKALDIAIDGVEKDDFTMVFGFPGRTSQYLTSKAVDNYIAKLLPARIEMRKNSLRHIDAAMSMDESTYIKYASKQSRISNAYKKWIGQDLGLRKKEAVKKKLAIEKDWLAKNKKNQALLNQLFELEDKKVDAQMAYNMFIEFYYYGPEMIRWATGFNSLIKSKEFEKDAKKKSESMQNFFKNYDVDIDKKVFASLVPIYVKHVNKSALSPELLDLISKYESTEEMVAALYKKSKLHNKEQVGKLLQGSQKSFQKKLKKDPIYNLAQSLLDHFLSEVRPGFSKMTLEEEKLMKQYVNSLMNTYPNKSFWADANSTLRLTYGKVEGSAPRDGMEYTWFTTIDGIVEKYNTGEADFEVPQRLLDLYEEKNYGRYGKNGTLNVCLLGSNHTTGGNSGSPALDAYGRLVGINFDRSWESTMSDVLFDKDICRNIMVDIRYVLWVIDIYAGAGHLVDEMNLVRN